MTWIHHYYTPNFKISLYVHFKLISSLHLMMQIISGCKSNQTLEDLRRQDKHKFKMTLVWLDKTSLMLQFALGKMVPITSIMGFRFLRTLVRVVIGVFLELCSLLPWFSSSSTNQKWRMSWWKSRVDFSGRAFHHLIRLILSSICWMTHKDYVRTSITSSIPNTSRLSSWAFNAGLYIRIRYKDHYHLAH